jgi:hypothetical protein
LAIFHRITCHPSFKLGFKTWQSDVQVGLEAHDHDLVRGYATIKRDIFGTSSQGIEIAMDIIDR